jgi:hypothetical protein
MSKSPRHRPGASPTLRTGASTRAHDSRLASRHFLLLATQTTRLNHQPVAAETAATKMGLSRYATAQTVCPVWTALQTFRCQFSK